MSLWITHFDFDHSRWYMRFTGPEQEFQKMREQLKRKPGYFARWTTYQWPDGKNGAWGMHGITLGEVKYSFSNLEGYCKRSESDIAWFYDCSFWLKNGQKGKGEFKYSLPK